MEKNALNPIFFVARLDFEVSAAILAFFGRH
jgi:hypothetical protein